jgi:hypothetical protein
VSAIYYDYAGQPDALALAKQLLDTFKATATDEQLTEFDPSGSSGGPVRDDSDKYGSDVASNAETSTTQTDATCLSNGLSTLSLDGRSGAGSEGSSDGGGYFRDTDHFDTQTKEQLLADTFPTLRSELVAYTLKKCNDDFSKATDELLNHVYFEDVKTSPTEEVSVVKGIDAFSEDYHVPQRGRKGKSKKKQRANLYAMNAVSSSGSDVSLTSPTNRWLNTSQDVGFITSRTNLSSKTVSSVYHEHGASLSATILAIVRKDMKAHEKDGEPDSAMVQDAITLNAEFPTIDLELTLALIRITDPSVVKAHDLAKALVEQPASETSAKGGIKLDLRYAPVDLSGSAMESSKLPELPSSMRPHNTASVARDRSEAFQKASAAYRRGKSSGLMKGAAAYYAQEGRDLSANLKVLNEADADALVSSQSSATHLDLHGVTVASATRIAKQRTQMWWNSLGERKIPEWGGARGGAGGYRIVVGLGRHSVDGRGKLGPAVAKALVNEGWKVEVGTGELLVTGLARRR